MSTGIIIRKLSYYQYSYYFMCLKIILKDSVFFFFNLGLVFSGELLLQGEEFELQLSSSLLNRASCHLDEVFSPTSITSIKSG